MAVLNQDLKAARTLLDSEDFDAAKTLCDEIIVDYPKAWRPHAVKANIAVKTADLPALQACLNALAERDVPEVTFYQLKYHAAVLGGRDEEELTALEKLVGSLPNSPKWTRLHLAKLAQLSKSDRFFPALKTALQNQPNMKVPYIWLRQMKPYFLPEVFFNLVTDVLEMTVERSSLRLARAVAAFDLDNEVGFWNDLEEAYKLNQDLILPRSVMRIIQSLIELEGPSRPAIFRLHRNHPKSVQIFWLYAMVLDQHGEHEAYCELITSNWNWISDHNPSLKASIVAMSNGLDDLQDRDARTKYFGFLLADQMSEAIKIAPSEADAELLNQIQSIRQGDVQIDYRAYWDSVTVSGPDRPNGTVLVFGGLADMFCLPANTLDHVFAALGLTAIYFKDYSRLLYLNGIKDVGEDYDQTLDWIRQKIVALGKSEKPLYTHGNSAGGLAAMIYGVDLEAEAALVYSPTSTFYGKGLEEIGDKRGQIIGRRAAKLLDTERFNLSKILARAPEHFHVSAYAAAGSKLDFEHAKRLQKMRGTSVTFLDDFDQHSILASVAQRYGLLNTIRKAYKLS